MHALRLAWLAFALTGCALEPEPPASDDPATFDGEKADGADALPWNAPVGWSTDRLPYQVRIVAPIEFPSASPPISQFYTRGVWSAQPTVSGTSCSLTREQPGVVAATGPLPVWQTSASPSDELPLSRRWARISVRGNPEGIIWVTCEKHANGADVPAITLGEVRDALGGDAPIAVIEPLKSAEDRLRDGPVWVRSPVTFQHAMRECVRSDLRMPTDEEISAIRDYAATQVPDGACVWSSRRVYDQARESTVTFTNISGAMQRGVRAIADASCVALCTPGLATVMEWGPDRPALEALLLQPRSPIPVSSDAGRVLEAERDLYLQGMRRVVATSRAPIDLHIESARPEDAQYRLTISYANEIGDACASLDVDVWEYGLGPSIRSVTASPVGPCE